MKRSQHRHADRRRIGRLRREWRANALTEASVAQALWMLRNELPDGSWPRVFPGAPPPQGIVVMSPPERT
jgi:hypothetical protein